MPFGDYSGSDDNVAMRLEMDAPKDMAQNLGSIHKAIDGIKTSLQSTNRFTQTFMDYMKQLPQVEERVSSMHQRTMDSINAVTHAAAAIPVQRPERVHSDPIPHLAPHHRSHAADPADVTPPPVVPPPTSPSAPTPERPTAPSPITPPREETAPPIATRDASVTSASTHVQSGRNTTIQANVVNITHSGSLQTHGTNTTVTAPASTISTQMPNTASAAAVPQPYAQAAGMLAATTPPPAPTPFNAPPAPTADQVAQQQPHHHVANVLASVGALEAAKAVEQHEKEQNSEDKKQTLSENSPVVGETRADGSKIIGHIPMPNTGVKHAGVIAAEKARAAAGIHARTVGAKRTPPVDKTTPQGNRTIPVHARPASVQSQLDARQRLADQIGSSPLEILDRLRARGMTAEGMYHGAPRETVTIGDKEMTKQEFLNDPQAHEDALDELTKSSMKKESAPIHERIATGAHNLGRIVDHMGPGYDPADTIREASTYIGGLAKGGGMLEGRPGLGAVAKGVAGVGALVVGAQEVGGKAQQIRNEGADRGGGFGTGLGIEMQTQQLALNPFISTEQARQVIMAGLNSGYSMGAPMDTVTQFMTRNLTEMNMSVAQSTELLNKNVKEGGQSLGGLSQQLDTLKHAAASGSKSLPDLIDQFTKISGQLVDAGGSGQASGTQAMLEANMFNQPRPDGSPNPLADVQPKIASQMWGSTSVQGILSSQFAPSGTLPSATVGLLSDQGTLDQDTQQILGEWIQQAVRNYPGDTDQDMQNAAAVLVKIAAGHQVNLNNKQARDYIEEYKKAGNSPRGFARSSTQQAQNSVNIASGNITGPNQSSGIGSAISQGWHNLVGGIDSLFGDSQGAQGNYAQAASAGGTYGNAALDRVTSSAGLANTIVYDPKGTPHTVNYNDPAQMKGLQAGTWKVATASTADQQAGLSKNWGQEAKQLSSSAVPLSQLAGTTTGGGGGGGKFDLTDRAAQLIKVLPPTSSTPTSSNNTNARAGYGGATTNNAPPGDPKASGRPLS